MKVENEKRKNVLPNKGINVTVFGLKICQISSYRIGLGNKRKIFYTQFLQAFEDPRLCGDMRTTLDVPTIPQEVVSFDTAQTMTEDEAITFLRAKVADNAETIHQVMAVLFSDGYWKIV